MGGQRFSASAHKLFSNAFADRQSGKILDTEPLTIRIAFEEDRLSNLRDCDVEAAKTQTEFPHVCVEPVMQFGTCVGAVL